MAVRLRAVTYEAQDPAGLAEFWGRLLGVAPTVDEIGPIVPGDGTRLGVRFVSRSGDKVWPNRTHLHLTSATPADQQRTVGVALALGASHLDVGQLPEEGHIVLADPGGNEFCVIEAGNNFLSGCGFLGELTCDGTREVGIFWSDALGWPLGWDQDGETSIQSPAGGTKVSWGGPPVAAHSQSHQQRFDLVTTRAECATEVDRLVSLGATVADRRADGTVLMADPDGNELFVRPVLER